MVVYEALVFDKKRHKVMKFLWTDKKKYKSSMIALFKAQKEGKIDVINHGVENKENIKHYKNQGVKL